MSAANKTDKYVGFGCGALIALCAGIGALSCGIQSCQHAQQVRQSELMLQEHERKIAEKRAAIEAAKTPEQREAERQAREARVAENKRKAEEARQQHLKEVEAERKRHAQIRSVLTTGLEAARKLADGPDFVLISAPVAMAETHIQENRFLRLPGELKQASSLAKKRLATTRKMRESAEKLPEHPDLHRYIEALRDLESYFGMTQKAADAWLLFIGTTDRDALDSARQFTTQLFQAWNSFEAIQRDLKHDYGIRE